MMQNKARTQAASLMGDPSELGVIYRAVRACADRSEAAPTNGSLAEAIGACSTSTPVRVLQRLAKTGAIKLESGAIERRITIVATGKQTAVSASFRTREEAKTSETAAAMRRGQEARRKAMEEARQSSLRRAEAYRLTTRNPLPIERDTRELIVPAKAVDQRPIAWSREPCIRCGTRGDLGCAHQQPYQELEPA